MYIWLDKEYCVGTVIIIGRSTNNLKQNFEILNILTRVWCWWLVVDPLDDFEAILSCDYCGTGNTGNEVLQRNTVLQCLIAQLQRAEFCCIAVWKTKWKIHYIIDFIMCGNML